MEEIKLNDNVFDQIKDFYHYKLTEEQKLLIDKLIINEELKTVINVIAYVMNVGSLIQVIATASHVILNIFNETLKIGLVEIMMLISLFKKYN